MEEGGRVPAARAAPSGVELQAPFEYLHELGRGGMGIVVAAHDRNLDRKVAIKVLRDDDGSGKGGSWLLREAQAMARLSHENIITVHHVENRAGQIYVVMELVEGPTLRRWMQEKQRGWREVLEVFRKAGQGLAAAHAAELVHRDFKPDNVLMHPDGRVLVTDFGLVSSAGTATAEGPLDPAALADTLAQGTAVETPGPMNVSLTRTGEVMGTPAYMAPEQHWCRPTDGRTDQFAFGVSLYEALYGRLPFAGSNYVEIVAAVVLDGKPRPPKDGSDVPAWLWPIVVRALATKPEDRFPSMEALLDALADDPALRRRKRLRIAGVSAGAVGLAALGFMVSPSDDKEAMCERAGAAIEQTWNAETRALLEQRFAGSVQWSTALPLLESYAKSWASTMEGACRGAHVEGTQSPTLFERQSACLARRHSEFGALVGLLATEDTALANAAQALESLPTVAVCADAEGLQGVPLPTGAAQAERVMELFEELARLDASTLAEGDAAAVPGAEKVLEQAREVDYPPLLARALYLRGLLASRLGDHKGAETLLREAAELAATAKEHRTQAEAWLTMIYVVGSGMSRGKDALVMVPAAEAALGHLEEDKRLRARLENNIGLAKSANRDKHGARAHLQRAVTLFEEAVGREGLDVAIACSNLATVESELGLFDAARDNITRALSIRTRVVGDGHALVASSLADRAYLAYQMNDLKGALADARTSLDMRQVTLGEDNPKTAGSKEFLATVLKDMGEAQEAAPLFAEAIAAYEALYGENAIQLAQPLANYGNLLSEQGQNRPSWTALARALAIVEWQKGHDDIAVVPYVTNLADWLSERGVLEQALPHYARAISVAHNSVGQMHEAHAKTLLSRGRAYLRAGQGDAAAKDFAKVVEIRAGIQAAQPHPRSQALLADSEFHLGHAYETAEDLGKAAQFYEQSLQHHRAVHGSEGLASQFALMGLGDVAALEHRHDDAQKFYAEVVELRRLAFGEEHHQYAAGLHLLGERYAAGGKLAEALQSFEASLEVQGKNTARDPAVFAVTQFEMAKVLHKMGQGVRANELATLARSAFLAAGERAEGNVEAIDAWRKGK